MLMIELAEEGRGVVLRLPFYLDPKQARVARLRRMGISENAIWVIDWIDRMVKMYGGIVRGHGRQWDWGQALCVEQYGPEPSNWSDDPTDADVARAVTWEQGEWPAWATTERLEEARP